MGITRRAAIAAPLLSLPLLSKRPQAQPSSLRIGILTDFPSLLQQQAVGGRVSVICAEQACSDFLKMDRSGSARVETIVADHQNKPDVGVAIARDWFDRGGVDMIVDVPGGSVARAVSQIAKQMSKVFVHTGYSYTNVLGSPPNPATLQWSPNLEQISAKICGALAQSWFLAGTDPKTVESIYKYVAGNGGKIAGSRSFDPQQTDFESLVREAAESGAQLLLSLAGPVSSAAIIKELAAWDRTTMRVVAPSLMASDIRTIGQVAAQRTVMAASFYWNLNDRTRNFAREIAAKADGQPPEWVHAGVYSGVLHYLKAAADIGFREAKDGRAVIARMKALSTDDAAFGKSRVDDSGQVLNPVYIFQVKSPTVSSSLWDDRRVIATLGDPGQQDTLPPCGSPSAPSSPPGCDPNVPHKFVLPT